MAKKVLEKLTAVAALLLITGCVGGQRPDQPHDSNRSFPLESGADAKSWMAMNQVCIPYYGKRMSDPSWLSGMAEVITGSEEQTSWQKKNSLIEGRKDTRRWLYKDRSDYYYLELGKNKWDGFCRVASVSPDINLMPVIKHDPRFSEFGQCQKEINGLPVTIYLFRHTEFKQLVMLAASLRGINFMSVGDVPEYATDKQVSKACEDYTA